MKKLTFDPSAAPDGPRKIKRKILEKHVQSASVDYARDNGCWARKFASPANRSVPDYLFAYHIICLLGEGAANYQQDKFAVEFKAPGKKATDAQLEEHSKMLAVGWDVYIIDDVEEFKALLFNRRAGLRGIHAHKNISYGSVPNWLK